MKAITILQPWASLIASGAKQIETRSWATKYRGQIAIHAAKSCKAYHMNFAFQEPFYSALKDQTGCMLDQGAEGSGKRILYPLPGSVIAIADLVDCLRVIGKVSLKIGNEKRVAAFLENDMKITDNELAFGDYTIGRYAWLLKNIKAIDPIPARGQQGLWNWAGEI